MPNRPKFLKIRPILNRPSYLRAMGCTLLWLGGKVVVTVEERGSVCDYSAVPLLNQCSSKIIFGSGIGCEGIHWIW